jgi:4-hydroxybenzoate polyprenyltransferase
MTTRPGDVLSLLRIQTAGFEGLVFLIGPLLAGQVISVTTGVLLWTLGALVSGYIFALNDLVDLPRDRLNPTRRASALVAGRVSERLALALSVALPLAAVLLVVMANWDSGPQAVFVLLLLLAAFVNVYQKATRRPLAMDLMFAVTMAGPLPVTVWAVAGCVGPVVWLGTATLLLLSLELNSVAGNLKDLASDLRTGFATVAISRGARLSSEGFLIPGCSYGRYVVSLHGAVTVAALMTVGYAVVGRPMWVGIGVLTLAVALSTWGFRDLVSMLAGRRRPSPRGRERYFAAGFSLLLLAVAARAPSGMFAAALATLATWELACRPQLLFQFVERLRADSS